MHEDIFTPIEELENREIRAYLGPFLKSVREALGLTQHNISDDTGFSIQTISKIENGRMPSFQAVSVQHLIGYYSDAYDISTGEFIENFCAYCEQMMTTGSVQ